MAQWGDFPPIIIDHQAREPKYTQLVRILETMIQGGVVAPHAQLPSENELFDLLGLSRSTIRKALDALTAAGLVYRQQGKGSFVAALAHDPGDAPRPGNPVASRGTVGLLVPSMDNEIYPQIVRGVEDVAAARGWTVFIANTYSDREREYSLLMQMRESRLDGLILEPTQAGFDQPGNATWQLLRGYPLPCVLLDNDIPGLEMSRVMIDDVAGGRLATEYLLSMGHRRIAWIGKESVLAAHDRRLGYRQAMAAAGLEIPPGYELSFNQDAEASQPGPRLTRQLLKRADRPTAIFYYNDELALRGLGAIREAGFSVPADVSVIAYDNIPSAAGLGLCTVEHPKYLIGRWAADILFDRLQSGQPATRRRLMVLPELVERASVSRLEATI